MCDAGDQDLEAIAADCRQFADDFRAAVATRLILAPALIEQVLVALVAGGHLLMEGHPGQSKQTLARLLAEAVGLEFVGTTLTSDLPPEALVGVETVGASSETGEGKLEFTPGMLFANVFYAEGVEAASDWVQAVLFEAMRQGLVGLGSHRHSLPEPFLVVAGVQPVSDEPPAALSPAQLDRFLLQAVVEYPTAEAEHEIAQRWHALSAQGLEPLRRKDCLAAYRRAVGAMPVTANVAGYAAAVVRATRPGNDLGPEFVERWIRLGVSPCGLAALVAAAKGRALLDGRTTPTRKDVCAIARPVLRHRLIANEEAAAASLTVDRLLGMLLDTVSIDDEYPAQ